MSSRSREDSKNPPLSQVLRYQNRDVVLRFSRDYNVDIHTSKKIFEDLLRFFWLSKKLKLEKKRSMNMLPIWLPIDHMWHTFLLFSRDYLKFCEKFFGGYLHHEPERGRKVRISKKTVSQDLDLYLNMIYDELGEDVVDRWFVEYPKLKFKKSI